jgi:hypothetical protein
VEGVVMGRNTLWAEGADIRAALSAVSGRLTARQVRLLACACARLDWKGLRAEESRRAVALAERRADGLADSSRLATAYLAARKAVGRWGSGWYAAAATLAAVAAFEALDPGDHIRALSPALAELSRWGNDSGECRFVGVLRDLLPPSGGRPFEARWRGPDVVALARQAYDARDMGVMPVLGDALEDAGCDWDELLSHCREPGRHARGCWALDAVLGQSHAG